MIPNIFGLKKDLNQTTILSDRPTNDLVPLSQYQSSPKTQKQARILIKRGYHRAKNLTVLGINRVSDHPYVKHLKKQSSPDDLI